MKEYLTSLAGKRVTVVGAGISNRPLIGLLAEAGVDLTVCDRESAEALGDFYAANAARGVKFSLGENYMDAVGGDVIFRTPGMHPGQPALRAAAENGSLVTSEMELFLSLCPSRVFAITGSDGKTTTTTLISELLKAAGYTVWLGGNIGHPLLAEVDKMQPSDAVVLELSSFQLHSMSCSPDVALVTNISPNHLDVHPSYQDYIDAKKQVFLGQKPGARLILNRDNEVTVSFAGEANGSVAWFSRQEPVENGAFLREDGMICLADDGVVTEVLPASEMRIPGVHNIENMMAAFAAVRGYADVETMRRVARSFTGVAHRLEKIRVLRGVTYINDSIASSPNRTIAGLACFAEKVILIAGGKDKGISYDAIGPAICEHVKKLYLTGMTAGVIQAAVEKAPEYRPGAPEIYIIDGFDEAIRAASAAAVPGDTVILSPASTSFDRFKNFEERGNRFRRVVEELE
ncbi:MAG: UDP-N-acetylmuramoyl-L-alanine--D-glutamate ligase [Oscillospiraceae bacterium]